MTVTIEAELKACVRDDAALRSALDRVAEGVPATYRDHYFDSSSGSFAASSQELRLRSVETTTVSVTCSPTRRQLSTT